MTGDLCSQIKPNQTNQNFLYKCSVNIKKKKEKVENHQLKALPC